MWKITYLAPLSNLKFDELQILTHTYVEKKNVPIPCTITVCCNQLVNFFFMEAKSNFKSFCYLSKKLKLKIKINSNKANLITLQLLQKSYNYLGI